MTDTDRDAVERIRLMLRRFLAERFKLRLHQEMQQLPIYELVMANPVMAPFGSELHKAARELRTRMRFYSVAPRRAKSTAVTCRQGCLLIRCPLGWPNGRR